MPDENKLSNLATRLRTMAQGRDTLDVAQFQFLDLEDIRTAYGARWPENQERIQAIAEGFLRRRMDPKDLLINAGGGYLMIFGAAVGPEAVAAAGALTHGLNEFFLGETGELPTPRMGATSLQAPVASLVETLADANFVDQPPEPTLDLDAVGPQTVDWRYQAVWDVKREVLSSWYLAPHMRGTMQRVPGYQFESTSITAAQSAAIDEASFAVSETALARLISSGRPALVGTCIHISTLTNQTTRSRMLAAIDRLDRGLVRYRLLKISAIPPGFPRLYLNEIVGGLKMKIPNIVLGAAWDEPDLAGLVLSGASAVGVTLPKTVLGPTAPVPLAKLLQKLASDIQAAHAARVRYFVEGQIDRDLAVKLAATTADNIVSPKIWPPVSQPDGMVKWPSSRLAAAA